MGYIVDVDELYSVQKAVGSKCGECSSALEKANDTVDSLVRADDFQGDLANSIQMYLKEIHSVILASITMAAVNLQTRCYLYYDGYVSQIDSGLHAHISEDELYNVKRHFSSIINSVDNVEDALTSNVQPVSDLIYLSAPSSTALINALESVRQHCIRLDTRITQFESDHAAKDFVEIDDIIANVRQLIESQMGGKRVAVRDYQPGMVAGMTDVAALAESLHSIQGYQASVEDDLIAAYEREKQMLQDLEDEREWVKWVATGICIVGSVTLIVVTAGGATPLVCAGVGAAVGLTSAAVNGFADNYVVNGSFVEGMNWADFGKNCVIGTVEGAISGFGGSIAYGSSVVKPLERAMMKTAMGIVENGSEGLINFAYDVGEAIIADGATFETIMEVAGESTESMMKNVLVGMATDAAGGYVGGIFDAQPGDKTVFQIIGEETVENLAEKEAQAGSSIVFDVVSGLSSGDSGMNILNDIDEDLRKSAREFVEDEIDSAISGGIDKAIDNKFEGNNTKRGKISKNILETVNETVSDTAGSIASGAVDQILSGEDFDPEKIWEENLDGGREIVKDAADGIGKRVADEVYSDRKFQNELKKRDYDHDGKVEIVTFDGFDGYSVTKEDYDAAMDSAGGVGYEGKRPQDILGIPRNVSVSEDNIEIHSYKPSSLKESDYKGKGKTNAIKIEHK